LHSQSRPKQGTAELTVPVAFDLVSEKRRLKVLDLIQEKRRLAEEEDQARRYFKAKELPDFTQPMIMPSQKLITVPVKPNFASDLLPKKQKPKEEASDKKKEPRDFLF
jgi:hypothetical protein